MRHCASKHCMLPWSASQGGAQCIPPFLRALHKCARKRALYRYSGKRQPLPCQPRCSSQRQKPPHDVMERLGRLPTRQGTVRRLNRLGLAPSTDDIGTHHTSPAGLNDSYNVCKQNAADYSSRPSNPPHRVIGSSIACYSHNLTRTRHGTWDTETVHGGQADFSLDRACIMRGWH